MNLLRRWWGLFRCSWRTSTVVSVLGLIFLLESFLAHQFYYFQKSVYFYYNSNVPQEAAPRKPVASHSVPSLHRNKHQASVQHSPGYASLSSATVIVAVCDHLYYEIGRLWYNQLTNLGYASHMLLAPSQQAAHLFRDSDFRHDVMDMFPPNQTRWPCELRKLKIGKQQYRRKLFAMRWDYVLQRLKGGRHVLLSDVDNIFSRHLPMSVMEESEYDVYHAYVHDFPHNVIQTLGGFSMCGCLTWVRASTAGIRFVESLLQSCMVNRTVGCGPLCDDQMEMGSLYAFHSFRNANWNVPDGLNVSFWKPSISGIVHVTGHKFTFWDVNTVYRGNIAGMEGRCPHQNWVAMPSNSMTPGRGGNFLEERLRRFEQWIYYCGNGTMGARSGDIR